MILNTCEMWSNGIKIAFFPKKWKKIAKHLGLRPQPPSVIRLSKLVCLHTSPNLHIFIFNSWFKRSPFWKLFVKCQTRPRLLIIHSTISLSHKKFLFRKFLMTSLHVIFGLALPQSKILATPMHEGGAFWAVPYPPNPCLCLLSESKLLYSNKRTSKLLPQNRSPQTLFFYETAKQIEWTWSSSLRFCDEDLCLFGLHLQIWGQNPYQRRIT